MRIYMGGGWMYGVPARDLTEEEWEALTDEQRQACAHLYKQPRPRRKETIAADNAAIVPASEGEAVPTHTEIEQEF